MNTIINGFHVVIDSRAATAAALLNDTIDTTQLIATILYDDGFLGAEINNPHVPYFVHLGIVMCDAEDRGEPKDADWKRSNADIYDKAPYVWAAKIRANRAIAAATERAALLLQLANVEAALRLLDLPVHQRALAERELSRLNDALAKR